MPVGPWGSLKILIVPDDGSTVVPVATGPSWIAPPPNCQLVGQVPPFKMVTGKPLVQRSKPETCQPPIKASRALPASWAHVRPRPNGISTTQFALIWCVRSKSEAPRRDLGSQELMTWPFSPPHSVTRSASDIKSIDLE